MTTIIEDARKILSVNDDEAGITLHAVGIRGVTKIEPYQENGINASITYLAIWKGCLIYERLPAVPLRITYDLDYCQ